MSENLNICQVNEVG